MSSQLHPNAALRVLRREMVRLDDSKRELVDAIGDPRIPAGVIGDQIRQCDRESAELVEAHKLLESIFDSREATLGIAAE